MEEAVSAILKAIEEMFNTVVAGVGVGIATSAVWALLAFLYNWKRNQEIERSIRKSIEPESITISIDGSVGTEIENSTSVPVTIRSVVLKGGERGHFEIRFSLNKQQSPKGSVENERGWVELPGQTKATWSFVFRPQDQQFLQRCRPISDIRVTAQYTTLFGTTKIIDIGPAKNLDAAHFEEFLDGRHFAQMEKNRAQGKPGLW